MACIVVYTMCTSGVFNVHQIGWFINSTQYKTKLLVSKNIIVSVRMMCKNRTLKKAVNIHAQKGI